MVWLVQRQSRSQKPNDVGLLNQGKTEIDFFMTSTKQMGLAGKVAIVLRAFASWEEIRKLGPCLGNITRMLLAKSKNISNGSKLLCQHLLSKLAKQSPVELHSQRKDHLGKQP